MGKILFTSDTHFGHDRDFIYEPRGFKSWIENGEEIVRRWNEKVSDGDTVYHLGDVMLGKDNEEQALEWISKLKGDIKLVIGNHDSDSRVKTFIERCKNVEVLGYAHMIKESGWTFYLSHYPTLTINGADSNSFKKTMVNNLFGHTHQSFKGFYDYGNQTNYGNMMHVGVDSSNCYPVELSEVIDFLKMVRAGNTIYE